MPKIRIDVNSPAPVYEQIVNSLRALLVAGELAPGNQLPTVRRLAVDLGVHHNTVAEAYRILAREGWLDLRRGRGAVVVARRAPAPLPEAMEAFARQLRQIVAKAIAEGLKQEKLAKQLEESAEKLREGGRR